MSAFLRPEWDTPPNGDFASYVERLTQSPRPVSESSMAPLSGDRAPAAKRRANRSAAHASAGRVESPQLSVSSASRAVLLRLLKALRHILLIAMLLLGALLFVKGSGSLIGIAFMGFLLWLVHSAVSALSTAVPVKDKAQAAPLQSLLHTLKQVQKSSSPHRK